MIDTHPSKMKEATSSVVRREQSTIEYIVQYNSWPKSLDFKPGRKGKGCYVSEHAGRRNNQALVVYNNSKLLEINHVTVETQMYDQIMKRLDAASLPLRIKLRSPNISPDQRGESAKRRKQRKKKRPSADLERG